MKYKSNKKNKIVIKRVHSVYFSLFLTFSLYPIYYVHYLSHSCYSTLYFVQVRVIYRKKKLVFYIFVPFFIQWFVIYIIFLCSSYSEAIKVIECLILAYV